MAHPVSKTMLICQNITCAKQGSLELLNILQQMCPPEVDLEPVGCLGQCGSGPMLLVMPDKIWYAHVQPEDLKIIIESHLYRGKPFQSKLYRKFHPSQNSLPKLFWWAVFGGAVITLGIIIWFLLGQTDYF